MINTLKLSEIANLTLLEENPLLPYNALKRIHLSNSQ